MFRKRELIRYFNTFEVGLSILSNLRLGPKIALLGLVADNEQKIVCSLSATKPDSLISMPINGKKE